MNYDQLRASINLNTDTSPTVYSVLKMIRALFQDVEAETGLTLSRCPVGEETVPQDMIWLIKELLSIYEDNSDVLQRNRATLDRMMAEILRTRDELEQLAGAADQLPQKEAEHKKLLEQLADARADKAAYEKLLSQITDAEKELALLERFDCDAARETLTVLQDQIRGLQEQIRELDGKVQSRIDEKKGLDKRISDLQQELAQMLQQKQSLEGQKRSFEEQKQQTGQQIANLVQETNDLNAELVRMEQDLPLRIQERDAARQRVADYRRDKLEPVTTERDALLMTQTQLQTEKAAAEKQITELTQRQQTLVMEISRKKEQYLLDSDEYQNKLEREKKLIAEQDELTRSLKKATEDLALRQDEYDELKDKTLPAAEKYLAAETKRRDELQAQIDDINTQCQNNAGKIEELEAVLPGRQEELRRLRSRYDALTITFTTNNQDILEMERQIRELEAKNNQERLDEYRAQLQAKRRELDDLARNCEKLDTQIQELDMNLKTKNEDCRTLEDLKRKKEEGLKGIEQTLSALKPCSTPEYRRRAETVNAQFQTLLSIRRNLADTVILARQTITGYERASGETNILELEEYLTQASARSLDVYQQLVKCANALNNHITEEPK